MSEDAFIPLSEPCLAGNARRYVGECFDTNFVSSVGPFVSRFEEEFARYVGSRYAIACASGTAAIHVALRLLGVASGDEVFVSTLTFVASANPILYEQATPVLVDSELDTWNMDPQLVVDELDRRARERRPLPKAVEVVHVLGHPAKIEPIAAACERHGVALIEDAAEALGARYTSGRFAGKHVGAIGKLGCFSFNGNKIITTGGGGMITTDDEALARRAKHLTTQARLSGKEYRHDEVGYNYRLTNLAAALGVAQLEELPSFLEKKRHIFERYDAAFAGWNGLSVPPRATFAESSRWLYTVSIDAARFGRDRSEVMAALERRKIDARPIWSPLHTLGLPDYREAPRLGGQNAERLFAEGLSIPSSVGLTEEQQTRVIRAFEALRVSA
jgi:aminotransferase in exopolysaccharide biosynthesis